MKIYRNERQKFSLNVFFALLIMIVGTVIISFIFYQFDFEFMITFTIIKCLLFFGLFWLITRILHIYDGKLAVLIALISSLVLFLTPQILAYMDILNYIPNFSISDYISLSINQNNTVTEIGTGGVHSYSADLFDNLFFEGFKFVSLIVISIILSLDVSRRPYSNIKKGYLKKTFEMKFNVYKPEPLNFLMNFNDSDRKIVISNLFKDKKRFDGIGLAVEGSLSIYELEGEPKKVLEIKKDIRNLGIGSRYLLSGEEYTFIKKLIADFNRKI